MDTAEDHDLHPHGVKQEESPRRPPHPGGGGGDRLKRDEWSEGAVSSLLEAYETKWVLRNRAKLKGQDWEDVARFVSSRANSTKSPKTQTQCKNKIESMKKRYRSESSAADDNASSSWPLYHRLHHLLRGAGAAAAAAPPPVMLPSPQLQHRHPPPLLLLEPSPAAALQALLPAVQVAQPQPATPPSLTIPALKMVPPPAFPLPPATIGTAAQNSHGSTGVDRVGGEEDHGASDRSKCSPGGHVSERNTDINAAAAADTDSSTPALVHSDGKERNNSKFGKRVKMKRKSGGGAGARRMMRSSSEWGMAESIRWLAEVVVRSEQARMDTVREVEKMRMEAEVKRGEMDLKRTEIVANTQLEIAKLFAAGLAPAVDSSLRIGRRN